MRMFTKFGLKFLGMFLLTLIACMAIGNRSAHAIFFNLSPDPNVPNDIGAYTKDQLQHCNYGSDPRVSPAFWPWLGGPTVHGANQVDVPYGSTSVPLTLNWASAVCSTPDFVPQSQLYVRDAVVTFPDNSYAGNTSFDNCPQGSPGWPGCRLLILNNGPNVGSYTSALKPFNFLTADPNGITQDTTIHIKVYARGINHIVDNVNNPHRDEYDCINYPPVPAVAGWDFGGCPDQPIDLYIYVHVNPAGAAYHDCRIDNTDNWDNTGKRVSISGWAKDLDYYPSGVNVIIDKRAWYPGIPAPTFFDLAPVGSYYHVANYTPQTFGPNPKPPAPPPVANQDWHNWWYVPTSELTPFNIDTQQHMVYVNLVDVDPSGNPIGQSKLDSFVLGNCAPPPPVDCPALQFLDANLNPLNGNIPEVGDVLTASFTSAPSLPSTATQYTVDSFAGAPSGLTSGTGPPGTIQIPNIKSPTPQTYNFTYRLSWNGPSAGNKTGCTGSVTFATKPYVSFYGNDVRAGSVFDNTVTAAGTTVPCDQPTNPLATILTYSGVESANSSQQNWRGAGVEYAAFALGEIDHFSSANLNNPRTNDGLARPPIDLTFGNYNDASGANIGNINASLYDSNKVEGYGGVNIPPKACVTDYFSQVSTSTNAGVNHLSGASPVTIGPKTVSGSPVDWYQGDVVIQNNITLNTAGWTEATIPSYYLVVKGNIYINASVTKLDGVYIAEQDPADPDNTGRIYTCAPGPTAAPGNHGLYSTTDLYTFCSPAANRLTVTGAFIAKEVKFQRAFGTLNQAHSNDTAGSNSAAEIFDFGPENYIATPNSVLKSGSTKVKYDYITSLPPIL